MLYINIIFTKIKKKIKKIMYMFYDDNNNIISYNIIISLSC